MPGVMPGPGLDSAEWQPEDFDAATRDEEIWVAVQNGHRLGFASVWTNDNFLHNLFVDPRTKAWAWVVCCWSSAEDIYPYGRLSVW
jgi:hypothetical protein